MNHARQVPATNMHAHEEKKTSRGTLGWGTLVLDGEVGKRERVRERKRTR